MSFKFYYDLISPPARAMYIVLKMSGTHFEDCPVALRKGEHKTEEFKNEINRFQCVPCINDRGFKLAESIAILRYLAAKSEIQPNLYPNDLKTQIRVDEFLEWQHIALRYSCSTYFKAKWINPLVEGKNPEPEYIANLIAKMELELDVLENVWLKDTDFLTSNNLTAADIFGACEIAQINLLDHDRDMKYPKIRAWMKRVRDNCNPNFDFAHRYVYRIIFNKIWNSKM